MYGLPRTSSQPSSRNPVVSTTSVSPSHLPIPVAVPERLQVAGGQGPAVGEDLPQAVIGLVDDHQQSGLWIIFRGCGCVWNCMKPIGRHNASGLSLLLPACPLLLQIGIGWDRPGCRRRHFRSRRLASRRRRSAVVRSPRPCPAAAGLARPARLAAAHCPAGGAGGACAGGGAGVAAGAGGPPCPRWPCPRRRSLGDRRGEGGAAAPAVHPEAGTSVCRSPSAVSALLRLTVPSGFLGTPAGENAGHCAEVDGERSATIPITPAADIPRFHAGLRGRTRSCH